MKEVNYLQKALEEATLDKLPMPPIDKTEKAVYYAIKRTCAHLAVIMHQSIENAFDSSVDTLCEWGWDSFKRDWNEHFIRSIQGEE